MSDRLERPGLAVEHEGDEGATAPFVLSGDEVDGLPGGQVRMDREQLHWLCAVAGPALLARHAGWLSPAQQLAERHPRPR